jgi:glycosyltransferase involved in cell wall biosynthesis
MLPAMMRKQGAFSKKVTTTAVDHQRQRPKSMSKTLKILHVGESVKGGAGTHLNELIPLQVNDLGDSQVVVLVPQEHISHLRNVAPQNIRTFSRPSRLRGLPSLVLAVVKTLAEVKPDILHAHSTVAGVVVRVIGFFFSVPVVYCPHGWAMDIEQSALKRRVISLVEFGLSFFCKRIIAVSEYERRRGMDLGIPAAKIVTIHNGICCDPPTIRPAEWQDNRLKVLFVGRLDCQKGVDVLLKAIEGLNDCVTVKVIGDSVAGDKAVDFNKHPHVEPLGWLSLNDVAANMMACDVVVMPSRWEGFGLVAIEAMRLSKPVIASTVGGLPEIIADRETGILFPSGDAEALHGILVDASVSQLKWMGQAGHTRFLRCFVADKMCTEIWQVYKDVLKNSLTRR